MHCQLKSFENILFDLGEGLPPKNSKLISLSPFVDQDLIRVGGCIEAAYISYSSKHQEIISNTNTHLLLYSYSMFI